MEFREWCFWILRVIADVAPNSKCTILSFIAKSYNPLGCIPSVTISAKVLIQQLWQTTINRDDTISETLFIKWKEMYSRHLSNLEITHWSGFGSDNRATRKYTGLLTRLSMLMPHVFILKSFCHRAKLNHFASRKIKGRAIETSKHSTIKIIGGIIASTICRFRSRIKLL